MSSYIIKIHYSTLVHCDWWWGVCSFFKISTSWCRGHKKGSCYHFCLWTTIIDDSPVWLWVILHCDSSKIQLHDMLWMTSSFVVGAMMSGRLFWLRRSLLSVLRSVRTLCNHTGVGSELSFCKGEELVVLGGVDQDWIRCRQGDKEGLVPIGYTSLIMWLLHHNCCTQSIKKQQNKYKYIF